MRQSLLALSVVLGLACQQASASGSSPKLGQEGSRDSAFAVVELFTSEGCSSCPPAEALLASIEQNHSPGVILLEYHVDYWDDLGWKDPFSRAAYSARQRWYSNNGRVYTPQMIIDGVDSFVGSDRAHAQRGIEQSLAKARTHSLDLNLSCGETNLFKLSANLKQQATNTPLLATALLTQDSVSSRVLRGENAGETLQHVHVVRELKQQPFAGSSVNFAFSRPTDFQANLVILLQEPAGAGSGRILAAASIPARCPGAAL